MHVNALRQGTEIDKEKGPWKLMGSGSHLPKVIAHKVNQESHFPALKGIIAKGGGGEWGKN